MLNIYTKMKTNICNIDSVLRQRLLQSRRECYTIDCHLFVDGIKLVRSYVIEQTGSDLLGNSKVTDKVITISPLSLQYTIIMESSFQLIRVINSNNKRSKGRMLW